MIRSLLVSMAAALVVAAAACDEPTTPDVPVPTRPDLAATSGGLDRGLDPAPPLYGRMTWSDEWAVLFLYRPPACVAYGVDLAEPDLAAIPAVFGCVPLRITGFSLTAPGTLSPQQANLRNAGEMAVWFVSRTDFDAARSDDGRITREEIEVAPSLLAATTTAYHELVHPEAVPGLPGGHSVTHLGIQARGTLADGRPFRVMASVNIPPGTDPGSFRGRVSIEIR